MQDFAPPPAYHRSDSASWHTQLHSMTQEQLEAELALCEREGAELQEYANQVLQQIADRCPDILEQVVNALEDSCWHTNAHTLAENDFFLKKAYIQTFSRM